MDTKNSGATAWAMGLPCVSERSLSDSESGRLRQITGSLRAQIATAWIVYLLVLIGVLCAPPPAGTTAEDLYALLVICIIAVGLPFAIVFTRDRRRELKGIAQDLASLQVKLFAGKISDDTVLDPAFHKLNKLSLTPRDSERNWQVEILSPSGRVWTSDGAAVPRWIVSTVADVANTPEGAAPIYWEPAGAGPNGETVERSTRRLSEAERQEILRIARDGWRKPLPLVIGLSVWLAIPISMLIASRHFDHLSYWSTFALLCAATGTVWYRFVKGLRRARVLGDDCEAGVIIVLKIQPKADAGPNAEELTLGYLPQSKLNWTENDLPAAWRRVKS